jgi:hypothetical protein
MSNLCFLHLVGYVVHVVQSTVQNVDVLFFMLGWAHYGWHNKRIMTQHVELVFSHLAGSTGHVVWYVVSRARDLWVVVPEACNVNSLFLLHGLARCWDHKKCARTRCTKHVFLHLVGSAGHILHSGASWASHMDTLFFMTGWVRCGFDKKHIKSYYAKYVFLHAIWSVGHVVHSDASRVQNVITLFFMLRWVPYASNKKHTGTHYAERVFFQFDGICRLRIAFWFIRGVKHRCTIFHAHKGLVWNRHVMPNLCFCI